VTYARFVVLFVALPAAASLWLCRDALRGGGWVSLAIVTAVVYGTAAPWDHAALTSGLWTVAAGRTAGVRLWSIPLEEWAFYGCQALLAGAWARRALERA